MKRGVTSLFAVAVVAATLDQWHGAAFSNYAPCHHRLPYTTDFDARTLRARSTVDEELSAPSSSLQFVGRTIFTSDPVSIPLDRGAASLLDFFRDTEHRDHLLLGHGTPPSDATDGEALPSVEPMIDVAPDLWDRYSQEAERAGTEAPCPSKDELLVVKSSGIPFPLGLTIFVESVVGAKLRVPAGNELSWGCESPYPEYQFTLIQDTVRAEGPRALVWVYDTLTGSGKEKKEQTTHSFSTLRVYPRGDELVFQSRSEIEINVHFPSVLLRLLPMRREKCNEMGSASIQKSFEERGRPSLDNFATAYIRWLGTQGHTL